MKTTLQATSLFNNFWSRFLNPVMLYISEHSRNSSPSYLIKVSFSHPRGIKEKKNQRINDNNSPSLSVIRVVSQRKTEVHARLS